MARATQNVHRRVCRVARAARQAVHARAVCCGIGTTFLTLALLTSSGRSLLDVEGAGLALGLGIVAGLAWILAQPFETDDIARRLDEGLRLDGALLSAYENALRPERAMAELGAKAVEDPRKWVRADTVAVPHYAGFLAVPLVALAALLQSVSLQHEAGRGAGLELRQVRDVAGGIQRALSDHAGDLDEDQLAAMTGALEDARTAAEGGGDPGAAMEAVAADLDALSQELPPGSEAAEALARLALEAEVLGTGEEQGASDAGDVAAEDAAPAAPDAATSVAEASAGDAEAAVDAEGQAESLDTSADSSGDGNLLGGAPGEAGAGDGEGGTPPGAAPSPEVSDSPEVSEPRGPAGRPEATARTGASARWWGERDDALVRRWMARSGAPKR